MLLHGTVAIDRTPSRGVRQHFGKNDPSAPIPTHLRGYFLWLLSETINATNIPKEIISVSALTVSIGYTSLPGKSPTEDYRRATVLPNPSCEASLLFFIITYCYHYTEFNEQFFVFFKVGIKSLSVNGLASLRY